MHAGRTFRCSFREMRPGQRRGRLRREGVTRRSGSHASAFTKTEASSDAGGATGVCRASPSALAASQDRQSRSWQSSCGRRRSPASPTSPKRWLAEQRSERESTRPARRNLDAPVCDGTRRPRPAVWTAPLHAERSGDRRLSHSFRAPSGRAGHHQQLGPPPAGKRTPSGCRSPVATSGPGSGEKNESYGCATSRSLSGSAIRMYQA